MQSSTMSFPMTHQGVRNLDAVKEPPLPYSGGRVAEQPDAVNVGPGERVASAVGGAALAAYGLSRGTVLGMTLGLVGAALVFRGLTGHCDVYAALGKDTSGNDPTEEVVYQKG
jgi:hypothetical protein